MAALGLGIGLSGEASAKNDKNKSSIEAAVEGSTLVVTGRLEDDDVVIRLSPDGRRVQVDDSAKGKVEFEFKLDKFDTIVVEARTGNDTIEIDDSKGSVGALKPITIRGGDGDDVLTGGFGAVSLDGGEGNDTLTGGDGDDASLVGGPGNDTFVWNPGDDSDILEGGEGTDMLIVNGGEGAESFVVVANGTRVRVDRLAPAPFFQDVGEVEQIVINGHGGDDFFAAVGNLAVLTSLTFDGGAGDDTINGGNGADVLIGGEGDDIVDGNQGADVAFLGAGADTFQWDPGDGSDSVEGEAGTDRMVFNGSNANELIELAANGGRVRLTRNLGNIVMDLDEVEAAVVRTLGGTDTVSVRDLSGTDMVHVEANLAGALGGDAGDGQVDQLVLHGTSGSDVVDVTGSGSGSTVTTTGVGAATVRVTTVEATDEVVVLLGEGEDTFSATTLPDGVGKLRVDGGAGNDTLISGAGSASSLLGGPGDDTFVWNPADADSDVVEGGEGTDTLVVNGSEGAESFVVVANGTRVRVDRIEPAPSHQDVGTVDQIVINGHGGDDFFAAVGNLAVLTSLTFDGGAGDDTINGGNGADVLIGGEGDDTVDGNQGADVAFLGAGADTFRWDPGDGSDSVEGETGADHFLFFGSAANESIDIAANGERVRFFRNLGSVTTDIDGVETIEFRALGGTDTVTVGDLSGTAVTNVAVDLTAGGGPDGLLDSVVVVGTNGDDSIAVAGDASAVSVTGLTATVTIGGADATDGLVVDTLAGNDVVDQSGLTPGTLVVTVI